MRLKNIFLIDLFSQPFSFSFDNDIKEKTKKTLIGVITSWIVLALGIFYFGYLLYTYATNGFSPKITHSTETLEYLNYTIPFTPAMVNIKYDEKKFKKHVMNYFDWFALIEESDDSD